MIQRSVNIVTLVHRIVLPANGWNQDVVTESARSGKTVLHVHPIAESALPKITAEMLHVQAQKPAHPALRTVGIARHRHPIVAMDHVMGTKCAIPALAIVVHVRHQIQIVPT